MATSKAQNKWRRKYKLVKRQLNVMARSATHNDLQALAVRYQLRGKAEAVTFAAFVAEALAQRAEFSKEAAQMLADFTEAYHRDRDIYAP